MALIAIFVLVFGAVLAAGSFALGTSAASAYAAQCHPGYDTFYSNYAECQGFADTAALFPRVVFLGLGLVVVGAVLLFFAVSRRVQAVPDIDVPLFGPKPP